MSMSMVISIASSIIMGLIAVVWGLHTRAISVALKQRKVDHDKDVASLKAECDRQQEMSHEIRENLKEILEKVTEMDKKVDLLDQKVRIRLNGRGK